jgi:hypothetical protein
MAGIAGGDPRVLATRDSPHERQQVLRRRAAPAPMIATSTGPCESAPTGEVGSSSQKGVSTGRCYASLR